MTEEQEKLHRAAHAVNTAAKLVEMELETIRAFLKECRDMENFGHIVDPTLYRDPERRAVSAVVKPSFQAALDFFNLYTAQMSLAKNALEKVRS